MEKQHLSFLHVLQINLDKVQYASLQENLQHCEFKPHNPCTQGEVSYWKPTKLSKRFIFFPWNRNVYVFLTFLPKKSISKIGLTNVLHKLHLRSWQTWVSGFCFFWELSIIQSVGYTATGCLEWGPLSQVPPWPYLHQQSEDRAWRKIVNCNRSTVWSRVRQPLSTYNSIQRQQYLVSFNEVKIRTIFLIYRILGRNAHPSTISLPLPCLPPHSLRSTG